jgi:bromodomain-containing protein 8
MFGEPGRPVDWFSQKSCALQYGNLLENVDTPKRKKRTDKSGSEHVETPGEAIVRNLTHGKNPSFKILSKCGVTMPHDSSAHVLVCLKL